MKAIFIADAHIRGLDDPKQNRLCSFLDSLKDIDRLFILGDVFDFWTRYSKVLEYHYSPLLARFRRLLENGTHIVYVEGNHDFSEGRKGFYANPGDWIKEFSYLVWEDGVLRLERYKK